MALKVHITRIGAKPIFMEQPSTAATLSHLNIVYLMQNNLKSTPTLVNVPEDRNIRKFPVHIIDMEAEE